MGAFYAMQMLWWLYGALSWLNRSLIAPYSRRGGGRLGGLWMEWKNCRWGRRKRDFSGPAHMWMQPAIHVITIWLWWWRAVSFVKPWMGESANICRPWGVLCSSRRHRRRSRHFNGIIYDGAEIPRNPLGIGINRMPIRVNQLGGENLLIESLFLSLNRPPQSMIKCTFVSSRNPDSDA